MYFAYTLTSNIQILVNHSKYTVDHFIHENKNKISSQVVFSYF